MFRSVIKVPVTIVMLPVRTGRGLASMRFSTVLAIATGAAAAYTAARRLMTRDDAVDELPEGLQQPAARAQTFLTDSRSNIAQAMTDADQERASAEEELHQEYLRKTGRLTD